ncbi:reverse transcriptase domain-containing protein [Tanacetum coccineum]
MPFGLCNAPTTFQRCMTAIFHELIEDSMEVFMDDFSVFGNSFDHCLKNLEKMLKRCKETSLVLNWEKCHFMVKKGIVLGHKVSECIQAFDKLKRELTQTSIMTKLDWSLPFKVMCDASDYAVEAVLGQRLDKDINPIHYASKTMNEAQENYTTTEKEFLVVVFAFDKFRQYLIRDKKGAENIATDHLSRLENTDLGKLTKAKIRDLFPEEQLMEISNKNNEPCVLTESYEGAWPEMRRHKSFNNVIADHLEDIMASPLLRERSLKPDSIGHIYSAMHVILRRRTLEVLKKFSLDNSWRTI